MNESYWHQILEILLGNPTCHLVPSIISLLKRKGKERERERGGGEREEEVIKIQFQWCPSVTAFWKIHNLRNLRLVNQSGCS